jgi:la-related protein 1
MSSTALRPAEAISTVPTFSYAQAAKGRTTSSTASAIQSSQATSGVTTPAKESASAIHTPSASVNGAAGSDAGDRNLNETHDVVNKADPLGLGINMEAKSKPISVSGSLPNSPSFGTASTSTLPKEEDLALAGSASDSVWDRNPRSASGTEKPSETNEGRRGKKGKKQKNAEKEPEKEKEEVKQEILVAAPPPAVNIWQQRKEAQAQMAKAKPSPSISQSSQAPDLSSTNDAALGQVSKQAETKRRGKATEDGDKSLGATQNGSNKDVSSSTKGQKKGSDGATKPKDDATKRSGPRGSRANEKDDKAPTTQLPPPVEDAISWPTPETALEDEKRKAQEKSEKEEKEESSSNKPRPKEKWVTVPYVPSVNFNTPLPARGGRGRGGGRGGREANGRGNHSSGGGATGEKSNHGSTTTAGTTGDLETRGRGDSNGARATSLPPNSTKRPSSGTRERKSPAGTTVEKSKTQTGASAKGDAGSAIPSQIEQSGEDNQNQQVGRSENSKKSDQIQGSSNEGNPKSITADRRESSARGSDQFKDGGNFGKDNGQGRDRADGRSDRGRGGLRGGRGNHSYPNSQNPQQTFTNGHAAQPPNGFPLRHNSNPYSSPIQQTPFSNQFTQPPSRGGRGGSRSQSIPNAGMYGRGFTGMQQMPQLQTANTFLDIQSMQSMSATPYNPFSMEHYSVLAMVTMQLEYYFSIDNLCKDVYLRKHMDSQGFVFLAFIAGFKRIQALTQDFDLLRYACHESRIIDIIQGEDAVDRVRRKEGWEKWVVTMEERDESVRNAGPKYHHRQQPRTQHMSQMALSGNQAMSPPPFTPNGTEPSFPPYPNEAPVVPTMNGNSIGHHPETPLSAAVPDFAPGLPPINGTSDSMEEETFSDEEVAALMLVTSPKTNIPFHGASSRTFSNGSIDGSSIAEEIHDTYRQGRTLTNGSRASETYALFPFRYVFTN